MRCTNDDMVKYVGMPCVCICVRRQVVQKCPFRCVPRRSSFSLLKFIKSRSCRYIRQSELCSGVPGILVLGKHRA